MGSDDRKRTRSDRHLKDEVNDDNKKSRSERLQHKISKLHKTFEQMFHKPDESNRKFKTRMERHEEQGEDEAETDDNQTKKYIPARRLTEEENETLELEKIDVKENEEEDKEEAKE